MSMAARAWKRRRRSDPIPGKDGFLAMGESVRIDRGERGNRRKALVHDVALFASEKGNEREIIRRRELRNAERVPMTKLADTRIGGKRRDVPGENRAGVGKTF